MSQNSSAKIPIGRIFLIAFSLFMVITCIIGYRKTVYGKEYFSPDSIEAKGTIIGKTENVKVKGEKATEYEIQYIGKDSDTITFKDSDPFYDEGEIGEEIDILYVPGDKKSGEIDFTLDESQSDFISKVMIVVGIIFLLIFIWNIRWIYKSRKKKS